MPTKSTYEITFVPTGATFTCIKGKEGLDWCLARLKENDVDEAIVKKFNNSTFYSLCDEKTNKETEKFQKLTALLTVVRTMEEPAKGKSKAEIAAVNLSRLITFALAVSKSTGVPFEPLVEVKEKTEKAEKKSNGKHAELPLKKVEKPVKQVSDDPEEESEEEAVIKPKPAKKAPAAKEEKAPKTVTVRKSAKKAAVSDEEDEKNDE